MERKKKLKAVSFSAVIRKEGINPYVDPPLGTGAALGRKGGVIPVKVWLDPSTSSGRVGMPFLAHLMPLGPKRTKAAPGTHHRLYLNGLMRKAIGKDEGDRVKAVLELDLKPRVEPMPPALAAALKKSPQAKAVFKDLSPSRQKEILRYLNHLKTPEALQRTLHEVLVYLRNPAATPKSHRHVIVRSISRR